MSKGTLYRNYLEIILQRHDIIYTRRGCFLQDELYLNNELWYSKLIGYNLFMVHVSIMCSSTTTILGESIRYVCKLY